MKIIYFYASNIFQQNFLSLNSLENNYPIKTEEKSTANNYTSACLATDGLMPSGKGLVSYKFKTFGGSMIVLD